MALMAARPASADSSDGCMPERAASAHPTSSAMHLLYVDDDRINLMLFEHACSVIPGVRLHTAADGSEALASVQAQRPDVLVIDLNLPDINGHDLLRVLRLNGGLPDTPAFLCTADDSATVRQAALDAGFQGCWAKPVDSATLSRELSALATATRP
jgi:CheY-like chemotaxis protein